MLLRETKLSWSLISFFRHYVARSAKEQEDMTWNLKAFGQKVAAPGIFQQESWTERGLPLRTQRACCSRGQPTPWHGAGPGHNTHTVNTANSGPLSSLTPRNKLKQKHEMKPEEEIETSTYEREWGLEDRCHGEDVIRDQALEHRHQAGWPWECGLALVPSGQGGHRFKGKLLLLLWRNSIPQVGFRTNTHWNVAKRGSGSLTTKYIRKEKLKVSPKCKWQM